ncbi:MAG: hypothetical protein JXB50_08320 [Spirochaetes bacterium]|nr:hypothetical protein [Spirochaetota bacterium]
MKETDFFGKLKKEKMIFVFPLTVILLFLNFYFNLFNVVHKEWFPLHQLDAESYIMGKMVKSHRDGIFSDAGLTGLVSPDDNPVSYDDNPFDFQFQAYLKNLEFGAYSTYDSHVGGQGMLFSMLDKLVPFSQRIKLYFFRMINAFFSAFILSIVLLWFYLEFGSTVYFTALASVFFSQWLTVFARNLWWCMWVFYLPLVMVMFYLRKNYDQSRFKLIAFGSIIFTAVLIKCFINGFEHITSFLVMLSVPLVYYAILYKMKIQKFIKLFFTTITGSLLAILIIIIILCTQVMIVKGSFFKGMEHIAYSFQKRTHADSRDFSYVDAESLEAGTTEVVAIYTLGSFFDLNNYFKVSNPFISNFILNIRYIYLIIIFLIFSILLYFRNKEYYANSNEQRKALMISTWFSILAPLSWFVIFKAHSFKHMHMDFLVWQMPFTIYGFAIVGLVVKNGLTELRRFFKGNKEKEKINVKNVKFTKGKVF